MFESLFSNIATLWVIVGAALVVMEAFVAPGVGFLFTGLAAIITGGLVSFGLIAPQDMLLQIAIFLMISAICAVVLWKKLRGFRQGKEVYRNIIGDTAIVESKALEKDADGQIKWSGTLMKARLAEDAKAKQIVSGREVIIEAINGNIAICRPAGEEKPS